MSDLWEIQKYVEAHPTNYEQRWRLTKRLYKEGEYRAALEHIQVLRNEWEPKPSVVRYHAATLTRLNRPAEAVRMLEKAGQEWPQDTEILEQLAMAYSRAGNLEDAASIWGDLASMVPDHKYARRAQDKLLREMRPERSDGSDSANETVPCSRCGTMNSPEVFECKNCLQRLDLIEDIVSSITSTSTERTKATITPWVKSGLLFLSLLYSAYAIMNALELKNAVAQDNFTVYVSWEQLMVEEFLFPRLILGGVLLVAWPLILRGAEVGAGLGGWFRLETAMTGMMWAALALAVSWIPGVGLIGWVLAVAGVSLAGTWLEYRDRPGVGLRIWIAEVSLVALILVIGITAVLGVGIFGQLPGIDAFSRIDRASTQLRISGTLSEPRIFQTQSSQSEWIDERASGLGLKISVSPEAVKREMTIQIMQDEVTILYESIVAREQYFDLKKIRPGLPAEVELLYGEDVQVTLDIVGVLPVTAL